MNKQRRWMQSVIKASKVDTTALPYQRRARRLAALAAPRAALLRTA